MDLMIGIRPTTATHRPSATATLVDAPNCSRSTAAKSINARSTGQIAPPRPHVFIGWHPHHVGMGGIRAMSAWVSCDPLVPTYCEVDQVGDSASPDTEVATDSDSEIPNKGRSADCC
mmetsp:Transcript_31067/g.90904  ORF Transcript_31067/g.90904 Transcript_31067/m.90904 type:complete len:117 (-) Transcript_31067:255-605(-)